MAQQPNTKWVTDTKAVETVEGWLGIELQSKSRTGNYWDNAAMEPFFATLAKECTNRVRFQTRQQARSAIFEYLKCFYKPIRLNSNNRVARLLSSKPMRQR